jgi:hypothetical protein
MERHFWLQAVKKEMRVNSLWSAISLLGFHALRTIASPMTDASQAPATKQDIAYLMGEIGKIYDIVSHLEEWKQEIVHEFHIVSEHLRHEYLGAHKDRIENHENRIKRVETHLQLTSL